MKNENEFYIRIRILILNVPGKKKQILYHSNQLIYYLISPLNKNVFFF